MFVIVLYLGGSNSLPAISLHSVQRGGKLDEITQLSVHKEGLALGEGGPAEGAFWCRVLLGGRGDALQAEVVPCMQKAALSKTRTRDICPRQCD